VIESCQLARAVRGCRFHWPAQVGPVRFRRAAQWGWFLAQSNSGGI